VTTVRIARRAKYLTMDRRAVNDSRLSFRARGVLAWLLDKPDGWRAAADQIANGAPEGRDAIRTVLRELEECGYLVRRKHRSSTGTWATEHVLFEHPDLAASGEDDDATSDVVDAPDVTNQGGFSALVEPVNQGGKPAPDNQRRITSAGFSGAKTRRLSATPVSDSAPDLCANRDGPSVPSTRPDGRIDEWIHQLAAAASDRNQRRQAELDSFVGRDITAAETMPTAPRRRQRFAEALEPFTDDQVNAAVATILRQLAEPIVKIRDPFAVLVTAARHNDPGYFPPVADDELEDRARRQLAALDAGRLQELDEAIRRRYHNTPSFDEWFALHPDNYRVAELVLQDHEQGAA
jgi:hypothetical protein